MLKLQAKYGFRNKEDVSLLVKSLKLSEEVGEFSENILKYLSYQRKEKLEVGLEMDKRFSRFSGIFYYLKQENK